MQERRRSPRFPLAFRVQLPQGAGTTQDVSGVGVRMQLDAPLQPGEVVEYTLIVPEAANVRCRGRVVRVTPDGGGYSVAATIDGYALSQTVDTERDDTGRFFRDLRASHPDGWEWGE